MSGGSQRTAEPRLHWRVQQAVKTLRPVLVSPGPRQARFASYAYAIESTPSRALVLSPIAAEAIPSGPARVVILDDEPYAIQSPHISARDAKTALVSLEGARITKLTSRRFQARAVDFDERVLVGSTGLDEGDLRVFPILDVSQGGCAIESTIGLARDTQLKSAEIWGDRRLLRRADATVLETLPWYAPDGTPRFRTRLQLSAPSAPQSPQPDRITDAHEVRRLLELTVVMGASVELSLPDDRRVRAEAVSLTADALVLRVPTDNVISSRVHCRFEVFGSDFGMHNRVVSWSVDEGIATLALPLFITRRRNRFQFRATVPPNADLTLEFRNPATGNRVSRALADLSFGGASFHFIPDEDVLWPGLPLESARLRWRSEEVELGEFRVQSLTSNPDTCHVALSRPAAVESPLFVDIMTWLRYPQMTAATGDEYDQLEQIYKDVGLFAPFIERNVAPIRDEVRATWRRMHASPLCRTLAQWDGPDAVAAVSAVRAYEHSWVVQHMGARRDRRAKSAGILQMCAADHILPRPDGRFVVFFVNAENRPVMAHFERFFELTGSSEAIAKVPIQLLVARGEPSPTHRDSELVVRPARKSDEPLIERAADRTFGRLAAASLSLRSGLMRLPDCEREYRKQGVLRRRRIHMVTKRGTVIAALLHEQSSRGFNLTWFLNACWVLPVHLHTEDKVLPDLARIAASIASEAGAGDRFVVLPQEVPTAPFEAIGFRAEASAQFVAYNRAGLHRYYYFVREWYGEVAAARQVRLGSARSA